MSTSNFYRPVPFDPARLRSEISAVPARPGAQEASAESLRAERKERAFQHLEDRRKRMRFFADAMFGEPAWEMLVILYACGDQARFTVGHLIGRAGAAYSSGLRWLQYLEKDQLVKRRASTTDGRVQYVDLTPMAEDLLDRYFSDPRTAPR